MKNTALILVFYALSCHCSPHKFSKAYKAFETGDEAKAQTLLSFYKHHITYSSASRYFLAVMAFKKSRETNNLLSLNEGLIKIDSLHRLLAPKMALKLQKKYKVDTTSIHELREDVQRWLVVNTRTAGTFGALDTLLTLMQQPVLSIQPELDSTHRMIVNTHMNSSDYDDMTQILKKHLPWVESKNFKKTRRMNQEIWAAFQSKYGSCETDKFVVDHPGSYISRDCWSQQARSLLCRSTTTELLRFYAQERHSALENFILTEIIDQNPDTTLLSESEKVLLNDIKIRNALTNIFLKKATTRDTATLMLQTRYYISQYAPRFSAFRLMENGLQYFIAQKQYTKAIEMLRFARPFFSDTLPKSCKTNFDFQFRAKPYIDGKLPILSAPEQSVVQTPLENLNTTYGDEHSPVLDEGRMILYFAASGRKENLDGTDVFCSQYKNDQWSTPVIIPELSGKGQQQPLSITADGKQMLLLINGALQMSQLDLNGHWSAPAALDIKGIPIIGKGVLSADGQTLIIEGAYSMGSAVNSPDIDLFYSLKNPQTGDWSVPAGMGSDINSDDNEGNAYLSKDGNSLYYTSFGYPGLGLSDVFVSHKTKSGWTHWERPQNMGKEMNDTMRHLGFGHVTNDGKRIILSLQMGDDEKGDLFEVIKD